jgi:2,5-diamino-6-(ribosylamino)-4(3H)-pyrimidinone 5'-phosphate reductase
MLPKVIIHNAISLDGRITDFEVDMEQYYELAIGFGEDCTLAGSNTILSSEDEIPTETDEDLVIPEPDPDDKRPILVIPDSKGRVRIWHALRNWPYWSHFVALVSEATPQEYLDYLKERHIDHIIAGKDKVDLRSALEELNKRFGVSKIRVDSGGMLNGVLLREGLVSEVSVLVHPTLVGGKAITSLFNTPESDDKNILLKLTHYEKFKENLIWLKYDVIKDP